MAEEKTVVFNLRKDSTKTPKWKRSKGAVSVLRRRLAKFSRTGEVKLDGKISEAIWARGARKPQTRIRVRVKKLDDGSVEAQLAG